ncbi:MAG: tetratricopeptide repeat protein [Flavobacteriaceae bacterium]|nr:tetratricopeptide repeat protein [Flavobacteriaceae bacterium]
MKKNHSSYYLLLLVYILSVNGVFSQNYANKSYYLIDSLEMDGLVINEKYIIHSSLTKFHNTNNLELKLQAINTIVEDSWNDDVWHKYNRWMYNFTKQELSEVLPITIRKNLNSKEKIFLKYYSNSLNNIGVIHDSEGKLSTGLAYYYKSLNIRERIKDSLGLAESYNNIGNSYALQNDIKKALEFTEKSRIVSKLIGSVNNGLFLSNLGLLHSRQGDMVKAMLYYNESLETYSKLNNTVGVANSLSLLAGLYEKEGELAESLIYLLESLVVLEENDYQFGIIRSLTNISRVYFKKGALAKAKLYGERAIELAINNGDPMQISYTSQVLSTIYQKENNWQQAFDMQKLYFKMKDSIQNNEIGKSLIRQQSKYDLEKKEQEIKLLSAKNEIQDLKLARNKYSITLISIALLLALVTAFVSFRGYNKKQLINKLLEKQKAEISEKNEAKKTMLQEIHHRVKNNLQVVNSLLRMQSRKMEDQNIIDMFKETQSRVMSMAKLHEKMYQSGDLERVNSKEYITMLVEDIVKSYSVDIPIDLDLDIEVIFIDALIMMPLSLIINEIITNSLKYAFKGREKGFITVKFNKLGDAHELMIGDDGIGYEPDVISTGLGSKLIQSFIRQLNGTIEKLNQPETGYKISF